MAADIDVANRFLRAMEVAVETGDREVVYPFLSPDVEWVNPRRTLRGLDEVRKELTWVEPAEHFDVEFDEGEWTELGGGRLACEVRHLYRWKQTGELAHERRRRIELTIRSGKIGRYEMQVVG
jgi:Domain of unknown function (DUF4440)